MFDKIKKVIVNISNLFEQKISVIYILVITIFILFLLNHILNHYLISLKVKKIEEFTNQITTTKKPIDTSILTNKDNLNSILSLNKVINEKNNNNYDNLGNKQAKQKKKNKQLNHPNLSDASIKYYQSQSLKDNKMKTKVANTKKAKKENPIQKKDKYEQYLQYYANNFNEYDKRPKNNSKYIPSTYSRIKFTSNADFKVADFANFDKNDLSNVKESSYSNLQKPNYNYNKLPNRNELPSCFKCQRPQNICHDAHKVKDFSKQNRLKGFDTPQISVEQLIKIQKSQETLLKGTTTTKSLLADEKPLTEEEKEKLKEKIKKQEQRQQDDVDSVEKNVDLPQQNEANQQNVEKEITKQERIEKNKKQQSYEEKIKNIKLKGCSNCVHKDIEDYKKFKAKYKQNYQTNKHQNKNEFSSILSFNSSNK